MKAMVCVREFNYEPDKNQKRRKAVHCQPGDAVPTGLPSDVLKHLCSIDAIRPEGSPMDVLVGDAYHGVNPAGAPAEDAA